MNYGQQYGPDWQKYGNYDNTAFPQYQLNTPQTPAPVSMAPQAASVAPVAPTNAAPNPWIQGAGLALGGVGTILGAHGAYQQSKEMDKQNDLARENFEFQKEMSLEEQEARRAQERLGLGQYAAGMDDRLYGRYGEYNRRTGG